MDFGLAGKVVIVTGATANIGRAIALEFATERARVVIVGRDAAAGARVVELARARGAEAAVFVRADLTDRQAPQLILEAAEALGPVLVLVNNVGGNVGAGLFIDSDPDTWEGDIDLNFTSTLRMTHAVLQGMRARGAGRIVNCVAPYGTISDDPEAFSQGSRFNAKSGFFAQTSAFRDAPPEEQAKRARKGVLQRGIAKPEEVAAAVVYLASDRAAGFVTGQVFQVDGGTLL